MTSLTFCLIRCVDALEGQIACAVLQLRLGLAHPAQPDVDTQKVESVLGIDDTGLLRMQLQAETAQHPAYLGQYPLAVGLGVQQDDEVESPGGTSPPGAHRTGRERLRSSGSYRPAVACRSLQ